jgi:hypothetical protein
VSAVNSSFLRRNGLKLALSALITVGMLVALKKGGLTFLPDASCFAHVRWWTIPVYFATLFILTWFRAVRWRFLLRSFADVPKRRLLSVSCIGFAAILLTPFRIGEFVRPYMVRTKGTVDAQGRTVGAVTMSAATGTIVAERIVDGLFLSTVLAIALLTVPMVRPVPDKVVGLPVTIAEIRFFGYGTFWLFAGGFAVLVVYYVARDFARRATLSIVGLVSKKLAERLASIVENLAGGLHFLGRARDALPFLWETTLYWFFNALGMWILLWGSGVLRDDGGIPTFGQACAMMGLLGVSILIPGPPGLLGPFQLGIYAGITMFFPEHFVLAEGAAYVFLLYVCQFVWTCSSAAWFLVADRGSLRKLEEAEGILPAEQDAEEPVEREKLAGPSTSP